MSLENPFAGQGAVLLDIGGDIGALVVAMPEGMEGVEVEVRRTGGHDHDTHHHHPHHPHHPHVAVVSRPIPGEVVPSLVFGELREGDYELVEKDGSDVRMTASVRGGEVTQLTWPE